MGLILDISHPVSCEGHTRTRGGGGGGIIAAKIMITAQ